MNSSRVFLDYNAGMPARKSIVEKIIPIFYMQGNYSSSHKEGRNINDIVNQSRNIIKESLKTQSAHIIFTSGGTEANNLALQGLPHYETIVSNGEHPSISNLNKTQIKIDKNGLINEEDLHEKLSQTSKKFLVSVIYANHETGVIQNIKNITKIVHSYGGIIHTDAVQAMGKIPINFSDLNVDMMSISGHKIGAPAGIGVLIKKKNIQLNSIMRGGSQELGFRPGTTSPALMYAMAWAVKMAAEEKNDHLLCLQTKLEKEITNICPQRIIAGEKSPRLPNTSCIVMPGCPSKLQVMLFDMENIAVSAGAACSSGYVTKSTILTNMGISPEHTECSIRFSTSHLNSLEDIEKAIQAWKKIYTSQKS